MPDTSALTQQSFDALRKDYYTLDRVRNLTFENRPFLAMIGKDTRFGGRRTPVPLIYGNSQARSASFAQAKALSTSSAVKSESFYVTESKDYSFATVDNFTIESTRSDKHAFLSAMRVAMDGAHNSLSDSVATSLWRDKSGYIGRVHSVPANATNMVIKLKSESDIAAFNLDQELEIFDAKSGGTQKISATGVNTFKVIAVRRSIGEIVCQQAATNDKTIAADDFLFVKGDRGARMAGVESWLPFERPTSGDNFFGVDRSKDPSRLAGVIHDGSSENMEQGLIKLAHLIAREGGGRPDYAWTSYNNLRDLVLVLGSKVQYIKVDVPYVKVGFHGIRIIGPTGDIKVIACPFLTDDFCYVLTMDTWKLRTVGEAVSISDTDSNRALRQDSADGVEIRYRFYGAVTCSAPGFNGVLKVK